MVVHPPSPTAAALAIKIAFKPILHFNLEGASKANA
jgi:hypothetical protein